MLTSTAALAAQRYEHHEQHGSIRSHDQKAPINVWFFLYCHILFSFLVACPLHNYKLQTGSKPEVIQ